MKLLAVVAIWLLAVAGASARALEPVPTPIGVGPRFHPAAANPKVARGEPINGLGCVRAASRRTAFHLELFAHGRVVIVPAGIGVAPPLAIRAAYVTSGRCSYAVRTLEPTGVVEIAMPLRPTLADFFAVWGKPLTATRLVGFTAAPGHRIRAYVGGRPWRGDIRAIPLTRHAQIVLELGPHVLPHASYRFPKGL